MDEAKGKRVKIFFRNGITCEGIVSKWENNEAILCALESDDVVFIPDIKEDIFMVRFFLSSSDEEAVEPIPKEGLPPIREPERPIVELPPAQEDLKPLDKQELRMKKLAELRAQQKQELEQKVASRVKSHVPTNIQRPTYAQPSFTSRFPKNNTSS